VGTLAVTSLSASHGTVYLCLSIAIAVVIVIVIAIAIITIPKEWHTSFTNPRTARATPLPTALLMSLSAV
jgi:hypothetical protein